MIHNFIIIDVQQERLTTVRIPWWTAQNQRSSMVQQETTNTETCKYYKH